MQTIGKYVGATRALDGDLIVSFAVSEDFTTLDKLEALRGSEIDIEVKKHSDKRSKQANAYFWKLCAEIAKVIRSDKDTVYLLQLAKYGVFVDMDVMPDAVPLLRRQFRYVQEYDDGLNSVIVRCYYGSSTYTKDEMRTLIAGTEQDADDLGIDMGIPRDELERWINMWEANK